MQIERDEPRDFCQMLRNVGLRPTRQRIDLAALLFARGHRHVSAETLHEEARAARIPVSLATVYNTLNQFTEAGLLREVSVEGSRAWFDTNTDEHHHFLIEDENALLDIPDALSFNRLPRPPEGMEVVGIDVVVKLRRKR